MTEISLTTHSTPTLPSLEGREGVRSRQQNSRSAIYSGKKFCSRLVHQVGDEIFSSKLINFPSFTGEGEIRGEWGLENFDIFEGPLRVMLPLVKGF